MNRADLTSQILLYEQLAAAARAKAAAYREQLDTDARAEYAAQGMAPTWRMQDVGTVTLPVSTEQIHLADRKALLEYAASRPPIEDAVAAVLDIKPDWQRDLEKHLVADGDLVVDTRTGEIVPGYAVRPGGQALALTIRPTTDARAVARNYAETLLEQFDAARTPKTPEVPQ